MNLLTLRQTVNLKGIDIPETTLRDWLFANKLKSYKKDERYLAVNEEEFLRLVSQVIVIWNRKGGTRKTTTSKLLADYYNYFYPEKKILLVDADAQASLTWACFKPENILYTEKKNFGKPKVLTMYDLIENDKSLNSIVIKYNEKIDLIPSDLRLDDKDNIDTTDLDPYVNKLKAFFKQYNLVIYDCAPNNRAFTRLGLLMANFLLCPVETTLPSYFGTTLALNNMARVTKRNENFVDYRIYISEREEKKYAINKHYEEIIRNEANKNILLNKLPAFFGIVESNHFNNNLFDMYYKDKRYKNKMEKIKSFFEEVDKLIYKKRENKG